MPSSGGAGLRVVDDARMAQHDEAITPDGLQALKAELAELEGPARRRMAVQLQAARELGDLKENADYHIAKEEQAHLETRIRRLRARLSAAVATEPPASGDVVGFGSTVHVVDVETGRKSTYTIVGPTESDPRSGKLSAQSPVAQALLGLKPADTVTVPTPRGQRRLRVSRIG
jgi:transcription elongation factor GreA